MNAFQVIVGNVGTVYDGDNRRQADSMFRTYVRESKLDSGRASGEPVTLCGPDGDPIREYTPPMAKLPPIKDLYPLLVSLKKGIRDDYRAQDADPDDTTPAMTVTVGWSDKSGEWAYQTGDNSYSGGAYPYPHWAVVHIDRRSDSRAVAREIRSQLAELASS